MKVKIFNIREAEETEDKVNRFLEGKNVIDIQYRPDGSHNNVLVSYHD